MASFDGKTKVKTRAGIGKDAWKPNMGALTKASQTDEALIHGTKKEQIDVSLMSTVNVHRLYQTNANFFCTVGAMRKLQDSIYLHTTNSMYKRDVMGPTFHNRVGPTMIVFIAPLVETHSSPRSLSEPAVTMAQVNQAIKVALDDQEVQGFSKAATGIKLEAIGMSATTLGFGTELNGGKAVASLIEDQTITFKAGTNPVKFFVQAISNTVGALKMTTKTTVSMLKFAGNSFTM